MIAYIALLILFMNLLLRVFHGKQNHGRIVSGLLWDLWIFSCVAVDEIRCMIEELASFVLVVCTALLAVFAVVLLCSSLKLIGITVYFLFCRIMEIDDITTLLWDRACDAVAATLAVAVVVWTMYHAIYVPLRFLVPRLLLLKRKCFCRGSVSWKPDPMMLQHHDVGDAPPVPTGVAAPRSLRIPRYTRVIPLLNDQQLAAALLEFGWKQDRYIREYQTDPRFDHWRGWMRTPAAIEAAKVVAVVKEPIADTTPVPTGVTAQRCLRIPRYTRVIPVLTDQRLAAALLQFDCKQDQYIREYESDPRYDYWHGCVQTPAAIEPTESVVAPVDAVVAEPIADPAIAVDSDPVAEEGVVPVDDVVEVGEEPDDATEAVVVPSAIERTEAFVAPVDTVVAEPIADPPIAVDDDPVVKEEVVPVDELVEVRDEPDNALNDPPDMEVPTDDSEDPVDDGLLQHDIIPEGEGEEKPLADPAVDVDNNSVAEEEVVPVADEEPDDALNDPPDVEEPMDDMEEPVDDGLLQHDAFREGEDQDLENAELPGENVDPVGIVVVAHDEEKVAHPVALRRSPRLGGVTGSVFLSTNTGRVVRRSARIMSRR